MTRNGANVAKFTLCGCPAPAATVFRPAARTIKRLLDGNHTGQQLFNGTPDTLHQLLTKRGLQLFRHPTGALAAELRTDDSVYTGWSRAAPARVAARAGPEPCRLAGSPPTGWCVPARVRLHSGAGFGLGTPGLAGMPRPTAVARRASGLRKNGDIVAARIDEEATVKTFQRTDGHVWLMPHNPAYAPILGDEATIMGRIVTVLRRV